MRVIIEMPQQLVDALERERPRSQPRAWLIRDLLERALRHCPTCQARKPVGDWCAVCHGCAKCQRVRCGGAGC